MVTVAVTATATMATTAGHVGGYYGSDNDFYFIPIVNLYT